MMKRVLSIMLLASVSFACSEDKLSQESVVDSRPQLEQTELDKWIEEEITKPYHIEVVYRWQKNANQSGTYTYPPLEDKVKPVLQAIKQLWLNLYEDSDIVGKDFLKGRVPLRLYLLGGSNLDPSGIQLLHNPQATPDAMYLYNVNAFDPKDREKVLLLMRSVHHQFALRLAQLKTYDRDAYGKITPTQYTSITELARISITSFKDRFGLSTYANQRGFYTLLSMLSYQDDFAEVVSATLCSTPQEISNAAVAAGTPYATDDPDPEVNQRYAQEAKIAHEAFLNKKAFVTNYMNNVLKINFGRLQVASFRRIDSYISSQN